MFSGIRNFVSRHRRKFLATGVVVSGSFLLAKYAQRKLRQFQEQQTRDFLETTRRMQYFESTERNGSQVIIGISTDLCNEIIKLINSDDIVERLRRNPDNKLELWDDLKTIAFTRLTAFVYATSMLNITLRIQMNVIGGYVYKDTVKEENRITDDIREAYLSSIRYFLTDGIVTLVRMIKSKVKHILTSQPLTARLTLSDLEQIFWSIQMSINSDPNDPNGKLCNYVIPRQLGSSGDILDTMYSETLDLLESTDVVTICSNSICRGFSIALDNIAESMGSTVRKALNTDESYIHVNKLEIVMAKIIPILNGMTSKSVDTWKNPQNLATSLVTSLLVSENCKTLGANIYEAFSI